MKLSDYFLQLGKQAEELERKLSSIDDAVDRRISEVEARRESAVGKREAAKILGCCTKTLELRLRTKNPPPHYIDGGKITFFPSEVRAWKELYRVGKVPKGKIENHASAV